MPSAKSRRNCLSANSPKHPIPQKFKFPACPSREISSEQRDAHSTHRRNLGLEWSYVSERFTRMSPNSLSNLFSANSSTHDAQQKFSILVVVRVASHHASSSRVIVFFSASFVQGNAHIRHITLDILASEWGLWIGILYCRLYISY